MGKRGPITLPIAAIALIIQLIIMLLGMGIGWGKIGANISALDGRLARVERMIDTWLRPPQ